MADLVSYALTTVADVKETLGISSGVTTKDNLIRRKINQATQVLEGYCGLPQDHHFKEATYTNEEYDGSGSNQLVLRMRPVSSLTSFQYNTTTTNEDDWDSVESELYFLDQEAGVIDLLFTQTKNWNRYRTTYTAGYSTIPADLSEACISLAAYFVENPLTGSAIRKKKEGMREIEYYSPTGNPQASSKSIVEDLGLDDLIARHVMTAITPDV